jgi:hypothetical protein
MIAIVFVFIALDEGMSGDAKSDATLNVGDGTEKDVTAGANVDVTAADSTSGNTRVIG